MIDENGRLISNYKNACMVRLFTIGGGVCRKTFNEALVSVFGKPEEIEDPRNADPDLLFREMKSGTDKFMGGVLRGLHAALDIKNYKLDITGILCRFTPGVMYDGEELVADSYKNVSQLGAEVSISVMEHHLKKLKALEMTGADRLLELNNLSISAVHAAECEAFARVIIAYDKATLDPEEVY